MAQSSHQCYSVVVSERRGSFRWKFLVIALASIIFLFHHSDSQYSIISENKRIFWKGCILRKKPILQKNSNFSDPCIKCAFDRDPKLVVRRKGWPQRMYNCTEFCNRVTVCTHARYHNGKDNGTYPNCYHCQNKKNENVVFRMILRVEICSEDCKTCITSKDLTSAPECAKFCRGLPGFCYPNEKLMQHRKCYQADSWYGCDYGLVTNETKLSSACKKCASIAQNASQAQECANDCDALPTFSVASKKSGNKNKRQFYECRPERPVVHGDLFVYDIPRKLIRYCHLNNPANFYMAENVARSNFLAGGIAKVILSPFNMSLLTFPRPRGFEDPERS